MFLSHKTSREKKELIFSLILFRKQVIDSSDVRHKNTQNFQQMKDLKIVSMLYVVSVVTQIIS